MSDRFEGTALLAPWEGIEYLHVLAVRENGDKKPHRMCIPVRPAGSPQNPKSMTWEYTIAGDTIHVSPSVKVTEEVPLGNRGELSTGKETFHSAGQWSVKFERFTPSEEIQWVDGVGDHGQRARFIELNPGDFSV